MTGLKREGPTRWAARSCAGALVFVSAIAGATDDDAGDQDAGTTPAADVWEKGAPSVPAPRPRGLPVRACSFARSVCVYAHAAGHAQALETLAVAERALSAVGGALALPLPDADVVTGSFDIYLVDRLEDGARVLSAGRDPISSFDRAAAFVELPRALTGCTRDLELQRAVLHAALLRSAPATGAGFALATTSHLAKLVSTCHGPSVLNDVAAFQRRPARALADVSSASFSRGASLFFDWADVRFGADPGGLVRASWALAPTTTPLGEAHFTPRPDLFDVFRTSFKEKLSVGSSLEDVLLRFAGARPAFGAHADTTTLAASRSWGDAAKVFTDFSIDWPAKPRRFSTLEPVAPTGTSYVAVRRAGAPPGSRLRIEVEWEEHARFRWMAIKLDAAGAVLGSVLVPSTPRATNAQATIAELDGVDTVLVAGMNAGDKDRPFDPDDGSWERHAYLLTLAAE